MTHLSALFIGGNGIISSACSRLAVAQGFDVTLLNRGRSTTRPPIDGTKTLIADAADPTAMRAAIGGRAFTGLLGNPQTVGDSVHITSDEALTWDAIAQDLARAAGADADIVHVASAQVVREIPEWEGPIIGDKSYSLVFDNTKIKRLVPGWTATIPFWRGAREIVDWYDAHPERQVVDPRLDQALDRLAATCA